MEIPRNYIRKYPGWPSAADLEENQLRWKQDDKRLQEICFQTKMHMKLIESLMCLSFSLAENDDE